MGGHLLRRRLIDCAEAQLLRQLVTLLQIGGGNIVHLWRESTFGREVGDEMLVVGEDVYLIAFGVQI
jgi:hypothetical protein